MNKLTQWLIDPYVKEEFGAPAGVLPSPSKKYVKKAKKKVDQLNKQIKYTDTFSTQHLDEAQDWDKIIAIYPGRFQPFGPHHLKVYKSLQKQFDDVYIVTSNIQKPPRHPLNFKEKKAHMVKMGIPSKNILMDNPYKPASLYRKFNPKKTVAVFVVGKKDKGRLSGGKYFQDYKKNKKDLKGFSTHGYVLQAPHISVNVAGKEISGTTMRTILGNPEIKPKQRQLLFKKLFGYWNASVYKMMTDRFGKLYEYVDNNLDKVRNEFHMLVESSIMAGAPVDDGPPIFYNSFSDYKINTEKWIRKTFEDIGWQIIDYMISKNAEDPGWDLTLKTSIVPAVSYGKTGGSEKEAISKYKQHVQDRILQNLGWQIVQWMGIKNDNTTTGVDIGISKVLPGTHNADKNTDLKESVNLDKEVEFLLEVDGMLLEEGVKFNNFLKDWAKKGKQPLDKVRQTMMNKNAFSVAKLNDFSVDKVLDGAKKGFKQYQKIINYVPDKIADKLHQTKFGKSKEKHLAKLDDYLKNHPKLKKVMGVAAAAGITYAWTKMTFIGDPEYDLDLSSAASAAAMGEYSMQDLFSGKMGTKFLVLTAVGATTGLTAPYTKILGSAGTMAAGVSFGAYRAYKARKQKKAGAEKKAKTSAPDTVKNPNPKGRKKTVNRQSAVRWVAKNKGNKAAKKYASGLSEINLDDEVNLLIEGGAAGHMSHPFDDNHLTFGDFKNIIDLSLSGQLNREDNVTEKLDGQNLMVSWIGGKLRAARNKGNLQNFGASSLDINGMASKFAGRGNIKDAFVFAMKDLEKAIGSLSDKQKEKVFGNGNKWMNLEVIYPKAPRIIDYDVSELFFHGSIEIDESGRTISQVKGSARMLEGMIRQVNQHVQRKFKISKPIALSLPKVQNYSKRKKYFLSKLRKLQTIYKLKDNDTLGMYHEMYWREYIFNGAKQHKYKISRPVLESLVRRWAYLDKSFRLDNKNIENDKFLSWAKGVDKFNLKKLQEDHIKPFELLFLELGAEILKNLEGFLAVNPKSAAKKLKNELGKAVSVLKSSKDIKKLNVLKKNLEKINSLGGSSAIVPSEGLVFKYKGKMYKFTGLFAPVNQILGAMKFVR